jgi:hypothetical protein
VSRWVELLSLRTLSQRDRRAVLIGLAVLLPAVLHVTAVRPYRASLADVRDRAAAERALLQREEALAAQAETLPSGLTVVQDRADRASRRLVRAANVPLAEAEVTGFLEELAQLSRVLLQDMRGIEPRRGEQPTVAGLRPIRLSVRGESDFEGVLTFLQRLESSPLLLRVAELSIEPQYEGSARGGDRRATGVVTFAVIVEAFSPADVEGAHATMEVRP